MRNHARFIKRFLAEPHSVGAIAPSSSWLAKALCEPYSRSTPPVDVLEVGAGTGAVTRYLGGVLKAADRLDICELAPMFVEVLRKQVLTQPTFEQAVREGRVRLLEGPVQEVIGDHRYDFIISGLPLTIFTAQQVREILDALKRCLKPGGVFSYFEYIGLRKLSSVVLSAAERQRAQEVSRILAGHIQAYQFDRRTVLRNIPPAYARHWRFDQGDGVRRAAYA